MRYDNPYMVWYRSITRPLVGNPAHRPSTGYLEVGSIIEIATRHVTSIHHLIDRVILAYGLAEALQHTCRARDLCTTTLHVLREQERITPLAGPLAPPPVEPQPPGSSSDQMPQSFGATEPYSSHVTPTMPAYTYHSESRDIPSSSRATSSEVRPRRTSPRHITSPVAYDQGSGYYTLGEDFDAYVDPLLASGQHIETPFMHTEGRVSPPMLSQYASLYPPSYTEGPSQDVSQITQAEPQPEPEPEPDPQRLHQITRVYESRRPRRDRRPPRCGTGGHV